MVRDQIFKSDLLIENLGLAINFYLSGFRLFFKEKKRKKNPWKRSEELCIEKKSKAGNFFFLTEIIIQIGGY